MQKYDILCDKIDLYDAKNIFTSESFISVYCDFFSFGHEQGPLVSLMLMTMHLNLKTQPLVQEFLR